EEEVEHHVDTCQSGLQRLQRKRVDIWRNFPQAIAGAPKSPLHIPFAEEQAQRDFRRAESAERLQSQDQPGIPRDRLVATDEKHSQQIVTNLIMKSRGHRMIGRYSRFIGGTLEYPQPPGIIPQGSNQVVVRDAVKPGSGVLG